MYRFIKFFIGISLLFMSCASDGGNEPVPKPKPDSEPDPTNVIERKVLLIGIDGCRPDALMAAETPNLDALMTNGTYSLDARNERTTSSGPAWSSMLTGVWEEKHGVQNNSFDGKQYDAYPHFFKRIKGEYPDYRTVSVSQWHPINTHIASPVVDIFRNPAYDIDDVKSKAVAELGVETLGALFVHFDDVDHAGHGSGFSPNNPNYIAAIESVDAAIGDLVTALKARAKYDKEDWIILVSTDHGGIGTSHGGNSEEERTIFLIASGDNVPNKEIAKAVTEITVPAVDNCLGSTTELYFENGAQVEVPNNAEHSFGDAQDFSIECRFRSDAANDVSIVAKKDWDSGLLPGYVFSFNPGNRNFKVNVGDGTNRVDVEASEITDNEWHTVSATFDRDGLLKVYVDGTLAGSSSMSSIGSLDNTFPLTIGTDGNNQYAFKGYVAEVRIFNALLNAGEVDAWKCKTLDNTHPKYGNLKGYWKLDEGSGTTIADSSPVRANGTLTDGVWEDATEDKVILIPNFSDTPRIVDVAATALNHLCIPIESVWAWDGKSMINTDCPD